MCFWECKETDLISAIKVLRMWWAEFSAHSAQLVSDWSIFIYSILGKCSFPYSYVKHIYFQHSHYILKGNFTQKFELID